VWLPDTCVDTRVREAVRWALAARDEVVANFLWDPESFDTEDDERAKLPEALRTVHPREWGKMGSIHDYFDSVVELVR